MIQDIIALVLTEYKKFRKNTVVRLLLATFILLTPLMILGAKRMFKYGRPPFPSALSLMEFPMIWDYSAYLNHHLIYVLLGFFVIYTITSEIANKTMRQNIITGYTKKEYFIAKLASYGVVALLATILFYVSTIILGFIHTDGVELSLVFDNRWMGLRYFLSCMGFMTFAMFISLWVRRSGLAIFTYFGFIVALEQILRAIWIYFTEHPESSRWFPLNVYEDLLPLPLYKIDSFINIFDKKVELVLDPFYASIIAVVYIGIFTSIAWWLFKRRDVL